MRFQSDGSTIVFDDGGMNLLSLEALRELREVIGQVSGPLLTFRFARSAGADMKQMIEFAPRDAEVFAREGQEVFAMIERLPMVTVAMIDGDCFGGALDLAMSFDFRFATPRSRFSHPGSRLGIVTGFGGTSRWRKLMNRPAANLLMIGNEILAAQEALRIGLVDRVADEHEEELERLRKLDPALVSTVKTLTVHADRLTRSQLALLATRLDSLWSEARRRASTAEDGRRSTSTAEEGRRSTDS